jgi:glucose/arabinose dehydrogenase
MRTRLSLLALEERLTPVTVPEGFAFSQVTAGLSAPTAFIEAPDGRIFVTEQKGDLRVITADGILLSTPAIDLVVDSIIERGLLGIALDPNFTTNGFVYLYYTVPATQSTPVHNRVSRFTLTGDVLDPASEFVLVDLDPLNHGAHNGGALRFGTDGKLYVAVGDNVVPANAQLVTNRFGKILRYNPDGTIPDDNPTMIAGIGTIPDGPNRAIYAAGFRNPFTFDVDPVTGAIYVNDVGQDAVEEVNELAAGRNFGWSTTEGPFDPIQYPDFTLPIISYLHTPGTLDGGYAVTGGAFYQPAVQTFPEEYRGDYFFNDLINGWIRVYDVATGTNTLFASKLNGLSVLGLETANDGSLLVLSYTDGAPNTGAVYRIQYTDQPTIVEHPNDLLRIPGQSATFSVVVNSTLPVSYQWQRDSMDIPDANESSYTIDGVMIEDHQAVFQVVISNSTGSVTSNPATLTVTTDLPPVIAIATPASGKTFEYGQTIEFNGIALDLEDGVLPPSKLSWRIDYITGDAPPRPFFPETPGISGGSVTLPTNSPYTRTDVSFRFVFTARDSFGNIVSATRDITPVLGSATLETDVPGTVLQIDGTPHATPYSFDGVVGQERTLTAPASVTVGSTDYQLLGWSDGSTENPRTISVAAGGIVYRANYIPANVPFALSPIVVGSEQQSLVKTFSASTGQNLFTYDLSILNLPPEFQFTESRVARGDINGDSIDDIIVGTGPGAVSSVIVINGETGAVITTIRAFEASFTGGVYVAAADLDGDGLDDIVVTPDLGGGPRVKIYRSGNPDEILADFFGIDDVNFRGGARASLGDINGDGRADLVVAAGFEGGPRVAAYDGTTIASNVPARLFNDFFAFEQTLRNGVFVTVGDFDGDGKGDIVAGGGPGGGPRVTIYSGAVLLASSSLQPIANFFAGNESGRNGVRLGVTDMDGDGDTDLLVGTAPGVTGQVIIYRAEDLNGSAAPQPARTIDAFDADFTGGVFVG